MTKADKSLTRIMLFSAAALIATGVGAHAQGNHTKHSHLQTMSSHARMQEHDAIPTRAAFYPTSMGPETGYQNTRAHGFERMDDPTAEGRTSGGG